MVRAPDPLRQSAGALGRADVNNEIDIAPVDAEIERGGCNHCLQFPRRHGAFHLAPLGRRQGAMVKRDWQVLSVHPPQLLKQQFSLHSCVDENQA